MLTNSSLMIFASTSKFHMYFSVIVKTSPMVRLQLYNRCFLLAFNGVTQGEIVLSKGPLQSVLEVWRDQL